MAPLKRDDPADAAFAAIVHVRKLRKTATDMRLALALGASPADSLAASLAAGVMCDEEGGGSGGDSGGGDSGGAAGGAGAGGGGSRTCVPGAEGGDALAVAEVTQKLLQNGRAIGLAKCGRSSGAARERANKAVLPGGPAGPAAAPPEASAAATAATVSRAEAAAATIVVMGKLMRHLDVRRSPGGVGREGQQQQQQQQEDRTSVGTIYWAKKNGEHHFCSISNMLALVRGEKLLDYGDATRVYTVAEEDGVRAFPQRVGDLARRLRKAADFAQLAGFLEYEDQHNFVEREAVPTPVAPAATYPGAPACMVELASALQLERSFPPGYGEDDAEGGVGNLSWVRPDGSWAHCGIGGVQKIMDLDLLGLPHNPTHAAVTQAYGPLCSFPERLFELAARLETIASAARRAGVKSVADRPLPRGSGRCRGSPGWAAPQ